jgi:hypothetical protein
VSVVRGEWETADLTVPVRIPDIPVAPVLSSINPATITAGSPDTPSTAIGTGFTVDHIVTLNGGEVPTTFVSDTQLDYVVPANYAATPVTFYVYVHKSGGMSSNQLPLVIEAVAAPALTLTAINPTSVNTGDPDTTFTLTGTGFDATCQVGVQGSLVAHTLISDTSIQAVVPASRLASPGSLGIFVTRGAETSDTLTFQVVSSVVPVVLDSIAPTSVPVGNTGPITFTGSGFTPDCLAQCGSTILTTTFVSVTELTAVLDPSMVLAPGTLSLRVFDNVTVSISAYLPLTVEAAAPAMTLTNINPFTAIVGAGNTPFDVNGTGFDATCVVRSDGVDLATVFLDATLMGATMPAAFLVAVSTMSVTVLKGAVETAGLPFNVVAAAKTTKKPAEKKRK